jgi:cellulose synthase/poly-beta-1,6-N-acetylglucosamine synthase-like glycosyltransferase
VIPEEHLPLFSVLVAVKNEEKVLPRLLNSLVSQDYPKDKVEIIVVEDGSTDSTVDVCRKFAVEYGERVKIFSGGSSSGKPSALNQALQAARGEIVAVFDADNVLEVGTLRNAAEHFLDESVVALQGRTLTINSDVNMLTKFVSREATIWLEAYIKGKDSLNLFVHLQGTCQFIRRDTLVSLGGWCDGHLSEDMEISARLTQRGHEIRYASNVRSWQESPQSVTQMFRQRARWYRGSMEVALKYGRLIRKPSLRTMDAEVTFLGPFVLIISLLSYIIAPFALSNAGESLLFVVTFAGWCVLTASLIVGAMTLLYVAKPKGKRDLLWLPFIYAYWGFQVFLATWAFLGIIFRVPWKWKKTTKTGTVKSTAPVLPACVAEKNVHGS